MNVQLKYKKIILPVLMLGVVAFSLMLVKRQQEIRRGATGLQSALLMFSPESIGVTINDKFDVNISVSTEATVSAVKLHLCYSTIIDLETQDTELASFNTYVNSVGEANGERCVEMVLTGMTSDDKLPSQFFKLLRLNFRAKDIGSGKIRIDTSKSQMVGVDGEIDLEKEVRNVEISIYSIGGGGGTGIITVTPTPRMRHWRCDLITKVCVEIGLEECEKIGESCFLNENCPIGYVCTYLITTPTMILSPTPTEGVVLTPTLAPDKQWWTCDENNKCILGASVCNSANILVGKCFYGVDCPQDFCTNTCLRCEDKINDYLGPNKKDGDYNCDGVVNGADYVVWRNEFIDKIMGESFESDGNCDGKVSIIDYSVWREWYLK